MTHQKKISEIQPGMHFVGYGPGWVVDSVKYAGQAEYGGSVERQLYRITLSNTETGEMRVLPVNGEYKMTTVEI